MRLQEELRLGGSRVLKQTALRDGAAQKVTGEQPGMQRDYYSDGQGMEGQWGGGGAGRHGETHLVVALLEDRRSFPWASAAGLQDALAENLCASSSGRRPGVEGWGILATLAAAVLPEPDTLEPETATRSP